MKVKQNEQRMMWLMLLIMVGVSAWFFDLQIISYICGFACMMSVMQYVDAIEQPTQQISEQQHLMMQATSKVPLYIASMLTFLGVIIESTLLTVVGFAFWVFFFLRWLQRLERQLHVLQQHPFHPIPATPMRDVPIEPPFSVTEKPTDHLIDQIQQWIFKGNPVLKAAIVILIIGMVLLLRFASEQWQLSLGLKLLGLTVLSLAIVGVGAYLAGRQRAFGIGLQGLGLASLFLILFFASNQNVMSSLVSISLCFVLIQALNIYLSLKQNSIELAMMAMLVAYLAPFTVFHQTMTAAELLTYYLAINVAIAVMTSLKAWKSLNQIAFLVTALIGTGYTLLQGDISTYKTGLSGLILAHSLIFIGLGLRFTYLVKRLKRWPILDVILVYIVPLTAFTALYLIHFQSVLWQTIFSLAYALIHLVSWYVLKRQESLQPVAESYLNIGLIFLMLLLPIALPDQWSVWGWCAVGLSLYIAALMLGRKSTLGLAQVGLIVAGLSALYYAMRLEPWPRHIFWVLNFTYLSVVLLSQYKAQFCSLLGHRGVAFLSLLSGFISVSVYVLCQDFLDGTHAQSLSLLGVAILFCGLNHIVLTQRADWSWLIPKWSALSCLLLISLGILLQRYDQGIFVWPSMSAQVYFGLACIVQAWTWLKPLASVQAEKDWVSVGVLLSLAAASLSLLPDLPYVSVVILPLLFCWWCYAQKEPRWAYFWQSQISLWLMATWMVLSQLFAQQQFFAYLLPVLNPFDLLSLAMLAGFVWMLWQQLQAGRDRGLISVLMVLGILWLSSHIVLRVLHVYLDTPHLSAALWDDAIVQLSLTALWVILAWIIMWYASAHKIKAIWILGGSILVLVSLKLVLFDLSHIGTLTRVISFLLAGGGMLLIAYLAPMPESDLIQDRH